MARDPIEVIEGPNEENLHQIQCGWGQCKYSSCRSFSGSGNTCMCGHNFYHQ